MAELALSDEISAVILAGGRGSRMGGVDKGLQNFRGMPLALHALMRLQGQVGAVMVNANRNLAAYESLGAEVWPDALPDHAGPLAGFLTGLERSNSAYLLPVPCDSPLFPVDLVARLAEAMAREDADIAMVRAPEAGKDGMSLRTQPVFCLLRRELLESLTRFTQEGGRKIDAWTALHKTAYADFGRPGDDPRSFFNANTLAELHALEA